MDFFGMGFGEILVILVIALLIFGPSKIVGLGKTLGKTVHEFKKATSEISTQVTRELEQEESAKSAAPISAAASPMTAATSAPAPDSATSSIAVPAVPSTTQKS